MVNLSIHLNQKIIRIETIAVTGPFGRYWGDDRAIAFQFNRCQIDYSKTFHKNDERKKKKMYKLIGFEFLLCLCFFIVHIFRWILGGNDELWKL